MSPSVKDWAIETFGTADKAVLVFGSLIVLAVIGSLVGILTVRGHRSQAYIVILFTGLIGVLAVLQRPAPSIAKMAPAVIGTAVSIAALWWLSEKFLDRAEPDPTRHAPSPWGSIRTTRLLVRIGRGGFGVGDHGRARAGAAAAVRDRR